jgi:hypothetical protein
VIAAIERVEINYVYIDVLAEAARRNQLRLVAVWLMLRSSDELVQGELFKAEGLERVCALYDVQYVGVLDDGLSIAWSRASKDWYKVASPILLLANLRSPQRRK